MEDWCRGFRARGILGNWVGFRLGSDDFVGASEDYYTQLFFLDGEGLVILDLLPLSFRYWLNDLLILIYCSA